MLNKVRWLWPPFMAFWVLIAVWEGVIWLFELSPIILPSPFQVFQALADKNIYLLTNVGITALASVLGFLLGGFASVLLATLFLSLTVMRKALYPYVVMFKSVPPVALAPLIVIWFGSNFLAEVILVATVSFFPILVGIMDGVEQVTETDQEIFAIYSANRWQKLLMLDFYRALPATFAAMKVSISLAVLGAILAEFITATRGIGYVIKNANYFLSTDLMFASLFYSALVVMILFALIEKSKKWIIFWSE
jgi:NitT/TauT family transport system permease protein